MVDDLTVLRSPQLWPEHPYLRIERRVESRQGQGTCFVRATDMNEVEPVVFVAPTWPPQEEDDPFVLTTFTDLAALLEQGWRIIYLIQN